MFLEKDVVDGTRARQFSMSKIFASSNRPRKFLVTLSSESQGNIRVIISYSEISPGICSPNVKIMTTSPHTKILDGAKAVLERRCLDFIRQSRVMEED